MNKKLKCILLIDDSEADNFIHKRVIQKMGCAEKVVTKDSGKAALEYLKSKENGQYVQPDLIFLDINMPGMNGWEFIEEYKKLKGAQQGGEVLVMLTTSLNPDDEQKARGIGLVSDFIRKPLLQEKLRVILEKYISDYKI